MSQLPTIEGVEVFLPRRAISLEESVVGFGLSRPQVRMLRRLHGFDEIRTDPDLPLLDLVTTAAREVLRTIADTATVKYVIFAHTVQTISPSHVHMAEAISASLGLTEAESFTISQQHCANSLSALDIAGELLHADGDPAARVLLVTGEKRLPSLAGVLGVSTAIGEASAACLIGLDGNGDRVLSYADRTRGVPPESTWEEYPSIAMAQYAEDLVYVIGEALRRANTQISDIDMVVPHNVSRMLWYRTSEALGIDRRRVFLDTVGPNGHCYCSDPFLNLVAMAEGGRLVPGRRYLLTSVGLGATHTAVVIECRRG